MCSEKRIQCIQDIKFAFYSIDIVNVKSRTLFLLLYTLTAATICVIIIMTIVIWQPVGNFHKILHRSILGYQVICEMPKAYTLKTKILFFAILVLILHFLSKNFKKYIISPVNYPP